MQWQSMKTARESSGLKWFTIQWEDGDRSVHVYEFVPVSAIAWAPFVTPTPYAGTLEELDAEVGDA